MPTVLLTGATGFIGSHLLGGLIQCGYQVLILKRSTSSLWRIKDLVGRYKSYDIDNTGVEAPFNEHRVDVVIHLATYYEKEDSLSTLQEMKAVNLDFSTDLLNCAVSSGVKGFINTGTFFEYDCRQLPVSECSEIRPFNFYAKTKIDFESVLKKSSADLAGRTMKIFSPYGEKDNNKLLPKIIKCAIEDRLLTLSEGFQKIDLIHVSDIVSAYLACTRAILRNSSPGYDVFNLGGGFPYSIRDIVSIVEDCAGRPLKKQYGKAATKEVDIAYADISKARQVLNWVPEVSAVSGVKRTFNYYKKVGF